MKIGLIFPGQGSQIAEMGEDLSRSLPQVHALYEQANAILGYDLLRACQNHNGELNDTRIVQPAILVHSVACWYLIQQMLEQPVEVMTGHSLGEISAVVCAGGLELSKAISLVRTRAELMSACAQDAGMMVVFALPEQPVMEVCAEITAPGHHVAIANRNAADQWVLSGHRKALQEAGERLEDLGGVVKPLNISIPAHSLLMAPIVPQFEEAIRQASPKNCHIPIISCISCVEYTSSSDIITMLSSQLTEAVNWPRTVSAFLARGIDTVIESGPKTVLRDLIRQEYPDICALSLGTVEDKNAVQHFLTVITRHPALSGARFSHAQVEAFLLSCLRLVVGTPCLKNLSPASFQQTVQLPYQKLVGDLDAIRESRSAQIDPTLFRRIAQSTLSLLRAKGLSPDQYRTLLDQAATGQEIHDVIAEYLL